MARITIYRVILVGSCINLPNNSYSLLLSAEFAFAKAHMSINLAAGMSRNQII